jgi:hypothetical protein
MQRIDKSEIVGEGRTGARAARFADAVGIGWYAMDLHDCVGSPTSTFAPTLPFQVPVGALIPVDVGNLLAACKNIGTTHLTNGAYRLHPIEWSIGESAGALAAYCCATSCTPSQVWAEQYHARRLQYRLLRRGVPVAWTLDVPQEHELFPVAQMLVAWGAIPSRGQRYQSLGVEPPTPLTRDDAAALVDAGLAQARGAPGVREGEEYAPAEQTMAARDDVERLLRTHGLPAPALADPPGWGEVAAAFAPLVDRALG